MSTTTQQNNKVPTTLRQFRAAGLFITVRQWEATNERAASVFLEVAQETNRPDPKRPDKFIWDRVTLQPGDITAVAAELQRAAVFAKQKEDALFA